MNSDLGVKPMRIQGIELPMHAYIFRTRDRVLYVFYCLWEQGNPDESPASTAQDLTVTKRLEAVRAGRRNAGQQVIEVVVSNVAGPAEAEAAVTKFLEKSIQL